MKFYAFTKLTKPCINCTQMDFVKQRFLVFCEDYGEIKLENRVTTEDMDYTYINGL